MGQPVVHFEVIGKDGDALRRYYGEMFGWEFEQPMGPTNYSTVKDPPNDVGGGIGDAPEGYPGHVTWYVQVPDVGAALDKAESLGGTKMMGPDDVPGVGITIGLFNDPEGHTVGLVSMPS